MKLKVRRTIDPRIDLTPMVDIVFLLLTFFTLMFFYMHSGIKVNLPRAKKHSYTSINKFEIVITGDDRIYISGGTAPVTMEELRRELSAVAEKPILLKGDWRASHGLVVQIYDLCKQIGIRSVDVATTAKGDAH